jgi:hypothetical protein
MMDIKVTAAAAVAVSHLSLNNTGNFSSGRDEFVRREERKMFHAKNSLE